MVVMRCSASSYRGFEALRGHISRESLNSTDDDDDDGFSGEFFGVMECLENTKHSASVG